VSTALLASLVTLFTQAHAAILNTGGPSCVPYGTTGFGDLDFQSNGTVKIKSSAATKQIVCTIPRDFMNGGTGNRTYFVDISNAGGKHTLATIYVTNHLGQLTGAMSPTVDPNTIGDGTFRLQYSIPASILNFLAYTTVFATVPGSRNGAILGFASQT
jgi:hypothetical protein